MKPLWLVISGAVLWGCKVPNLDHCYHQSSKPNTWCIEHHPSRPYCSPCEEANGCVTIEPTLDECPDYVPGTGEPSTDSEAETETGSESSGGSAADSESAPSSPIQR